MDEDLLRLLVDEFTERFRAGERPEVEEYARRHPVLAARLRAILPALELLEGAGGIEAPPSPGRTTTPPRPAAGPGSLPPAGTPG